MRPIRERKEVGKLEKKAEQEMKKNGVEKGKIIEEKRKKIK